ncbi:DUF1838 family protein [Povalibacter sp.]|uniref:DUF1838 family protein n=1 Tax=Povalibacter sp. TaxID=1962978 RepID=UPI002F421B0A
MLNRRTFIAAGAALGATAPALAAAAGSATTAGQLNSADPNEVLNALVKLRASLDGRIAFWWMKGPRYGVVGTTVTPLFNNYVVSWHRFVRQPDGNYKSSIVELSYYVDLATGQPIEKWRNPITGQMNDLEHIAFGPVTSTRTPHGVAPPDKTPGVEMRLKSTLGVLAQHNDDIWVQEDVSATMTPTTPGRAPYSGNDMATYQGSVRQLLDPSLLGVDAVMHYQSVTAWRSWMKMGDIKGTLMARAMGQKVWSVDDVPSDIMALARRMHPAMIADPVATLEMTPPERSFHR